MKFIKEPLNQFIRLDNSCSIILFAATSVTLAFANNPLSEQFKFLEKPYLDHKIQEWTSNIIMPDFTLANTGVIFVLNATTNV